MKKLPAIKLLILFALSSSAEASIPLIFKLKEKNLPVYQHRCNVVPLHHKLTDDRNQNFWMSLEY